jgi:phage gp36-like protein
VYADRDELFRRKPEHVILDAVDSERVGEWSEFTYERVNSALQDATDLIDSYIGKRYSLPLTPAPRYLKRLTCDIAYYTCLSFRGFREGTADDSVIRDYEEALKWLRAVSDGKAAIPSDDGSALPYANAQGGTLTPSLTPEIESAPSKFSREKLRGF